MTVQSWFPTFYRLYRVWRNRFTLGGKVLTLLTVFSVPALGAPDSPLLLLFGGSVALLIAAAIVNSRHRVRLESTKMLRASTTVGEPVTVNAELKNTSTRAGFDLNITASLADSALTAQADTEVEMLAPGEQTTVALRLDPKRRGAYSLPDLQIATAFPLNLVLRRWKLRLIGELVVYPRRAVLDEFSRALHRHDMDGDTMATSFLSGRSSDYEGSREYQPGIPVRRWDYSSWARTSQPVVREFGDDQQTSFAIAIDPSVAAVSASEPSAEFEALMSLAVGVACWLLENNRRVGAFLLGDRFLSGDASLDNMLDMLARAQPESGDAALEQLANNIESMLYGQNGVIFLTAKWDSRRASFCKQIRELRPIQAIIAGEEGPESEFADYVSVSDILAQRRLQL